MVDDDSGKSIEQHPVQEGPDSGAVNPPPSPNNPPSPPTQSVTDKGVESAVHAIEDRARRAEWLMIGLTAAIVLSAIGGVIVGALQWSTMRGQLGEMYRQFEITQRAYLSAKEPETVLGPLPVFKVPIENYGHVPSHWFTVHTNYIRMRPFPFPPVELDNRTTDIKSDQLIYPGEKNSNITIMIPQLYRDGQAVMNGAQGLLVRARITYDTGFRQTDILTICENYRPELKRWRSCGSTGVNIDLGQAESSQQPK